MKALRRSIKGEKNEPKVQHISITPKSAVAIVPPKKVIRALYDYEAQSTQELSFSKGDFFHVIGRENDTEWYEACNPAVPDARGIVPVAFFQALGRTERDSGQSDVSSASTKIPDHDSGFSEPAGNGLDSRMSKSLGKGSGAMVYGIVMYDFAAERPDELEAKQGEAIIVIAQSNPEWFVAKPIGRLGGPGLIPVSYIEIRDMSSGAPVSDASAAVQKAGVPKVEEWKKMAADYKNSSITLGKFEAANAERAAAAAAQQQQLEQGMDRMSLQQRQSQNGQNSQQRQSAQRPQQPAQPIQNDYQQELPSELVAPVSASIPRFCFAEEKYWFVVEVQHEDGRWWELSRFYEDFYDFQIALLTQFPAEAGNMNGQKRTLPYMPGPVNYVTDAITDGRRHNLDAYVKNLLAQPPYIAGCDLVKQFFNPREGDSELDPETIFNEEGSDPEADYNAEQEAQQQQHESNNYAHSASHSVSHSQGSRPSTAQQQMPDYNRQPSSMSQATTIATTNTASATATKIKIYFGDDVIAIRVASDIAFQALYEKIRDRLQIPETENILINYKDDPSGEKPPLISNNDLDFALSRNPKLVLYVEVA